jgi:hypothetical protein
MDHTDSTDVRKLRGGYSPPKRRHLKPTTRGTPTLLPGFLSTCKMTPDEREIVADQLTTVAWQASRATLELLTRQDPPPDPVAGA